MPRSRVAVVEEKHSDLTAKRKAREDWAALEHAEIAGMEKRLMELEVAREGRASPTSTQQDILVHSPSIRDLCTTCGTSSCPSDVCVSRGVCISRCKRGLGLESGWQMASTGRLAGDLAMLQRFARVEAGACCGNQQ
eukprot:1958357-Amphidinium_carterae.2